MDATWYAFHDEGREVALRQCDRSRGHLTVLNPPQSRERVVHDCGAVTEGLELWYQTHQKEKARQERRCQQRPDQRADWYECVAADSHHAAVAMPCLPVAYSGE